MTRAPWPDSTEPVSVPHRLALTGLYGGIEMRFGLFGSAQANGSDLGAGIGQGFHDYIDFNVEAEALGYHSTFLVEHHFSGWNQVSAPLTLLTWLAARTTTRQASSNARASSRSLTTRLNCSKYIPDTGS